MWGRIKMEKTDNRKEQTKWMGNEHGRQKGIKSTKEMKERRRKVMREMAGCRKKECQKSTGEVMNGNKDMEGIREKNNGDGE